MSAAPRDDAARNAPRLASLDALRGLDMVWIVGGRELVLALLTLAGLESARAVVEHHLEHAPWHGFRAWDLVFPLFLFLAGVSTAFSLDARRARGVSRRGLFLYALRRGLALVLLGAIYNGLLGFDLAQQRWASVLGRIGLAWMLAAWLALWLGPRGRAWATAAILVGYGALLLLVPVPGHGAGDLARGHNLADWIDQRLLPGRLHAGDHDPEGLFSTLPAVATALLGMLAGAHLRRVDLDRRQRALRLAGAGLLALAAGHLADLVLPLNKRLWTSSFVLVCAGWSALLLALFHAVFDAPVPGPARRRAAFALSVVGAHSLVAYMTWRFVDFPGLARLLCGEAVDRGLLHEALLPGLALGLLWLALLALHLRRRSPR